MNRPFLIMAMPRSRSFWTSRFLGTETQPVDHDAACRFRSTEDMKDYFSTRCPIGVVDTSLGFIWKKVLESCPQVRIAVLRRPVVECLASVKRVGLDAPHVERALTELSRRLDSLELEMAVPSFTFRDLSTERGCERLWRFCHYGNAAKPFDHQRWLDMRDQILEADHAAIKADIAANIDGARALFAMPRAA